MYNIQDKKHEKMFFWTLDWIGLAVKCQKWETVSVCVKESRTIFLHSAATELYVYEYQVAVQCHDIFSRSHSMLLALFYNPGSLHDWKYIWITGIHGKIIYLHHLDFLCCVLKREISCRRRDHFQECARQLGK